MPPDRKPFAARVRRPLSEAENSATTRKLDRHRLAGKCTPASTELTQECSEVSKRRSLCSCEVPERTDGRSGLEKSIGPRSGPVQMPSFWVYAPGHVRP